MVFGDDDECGDYYFDDNEDVAHVCAADGNAPSHEGYDADVDDDDDDNDDEDDDDDGDDDDDDGNAGKEQKQAIVVLPYKRPINIQPWKVLSVHFMEQLNAPHANLTLSKPSSSLILLLHHFLPFIHPFVHSFVHSLIHSFIFSFIHSSFHLFIHPSIQCHYRGWRRDVFIQPIKRGDSMKRPLEVKVRDLKIIPANSYECHRWRVLLAQLFIEVNILIYNYYII